MARSPNHSYEKRQKELAKKQRREEKLARKRAARDARTEEETPPREPETGT